MNRENEMAKVSKKLILENVRCSYVNVVEKNQFGNYSIQPIIEKGTKQHKGIVKIVNDILSEAFGPESLKKKGRYKLPVRDGDDEIENNDKGEEVANCIFFNANNSKRKPGVVKYYSAQDEVKNADPDDIEELCFSGAYFNLSLSFYNFTPDKEKGGKPGVAVGLNSVMLLKKGKRLDGSVAATKEFEDYKSDDDNDNNEEPSNDDEDF